MRTTHTLPVVVATLALAGSACAQWTLVSDSREIVGFGEAEDSTGYDFGSEDLFPFFFFDEWYGYAFGEGFVPAADGTGAAEQYSEATPSLIVGEGMAEAGAYSDGAGRSTGFAYSRMEFVVSFTETQAIKLDAALDATGESRTWLRVWESSTSPNDPALHDFTTLGGPLTVDETITLPAGSYRFIARADANVMFNYTPGSGSGQGTYEVTIEAADGLCYADCDGNGLLNILDYICFGDDFAAGGSYADCDGNGSLNILDYICFGDVFATGCP